MGLDVVIAGAGGSTILPCVNRLETLVQYFVNRVGFPWLGDQEFDMKLDIIGRIWAS